MHDCLVLLPMQLSHHPSVLTTERVPARPTMLGNHQEATAWLLIILNSYRKVPGYLVGVRPGFELGLERRGAKAEPLGVRACSAQ